MHWIKITALDPTLQKFSFSVIQKKCIAVYKRVFVTLIWDVLLCIQRCEDRKQRPCTRPGTVFWSSPYDAESQAPS